MSDKNVRGHWGSRLGFILAAAGSAVGLGNLWKFPYISWQNGGGLFIIIYLVAIIIVGFPIMISEISIGKITNKDPVGALKKLSHKKSPFRVVGVLGVLSAFVILSYYSVVAGWGVQYSVFSIQGKFKAVPAAKVSILMHKEENKQFIMKTALTEALGNPLPDKEKKQILIDAAAITNTNDLTSNSLNEIWLSKRKNIIKDLSYNLNLEKWEKYYFSQMQKKEDYNNWLKEKLLPIYSGEIFSDFIGDSKRTTFFHSITMLITLLIVFGGIHKGIERFSGIFMPILFFMMIILVVNSLMLDKEQEGVRFLIYGEPGKITAYSFLEALGHAFFTLSLGMGAMMTYGSYMKKNSDVILNAFWVTVMDTTVALLACLMIFPIIFAYGLQPGGMEILFTTLPLEFFKFKGGQFLSLLFYLLVLLAAITSAISLLEVVVSYLIDEFKITRRKAVGISAGVIFLAGIPSAMSVSFLSNADMLASRFMLPLGGLLIAIFVGYKMDISLIQKEFDDHKYPKWMFSAFKISIRYITPAAVTVVMLTPLIKKIIQ